MVCYRAVFKDSQIDLTKKVPLNWLLQRGKESLIALYVFVLFCFISLGGGGSDQLFLSPLRIAITWSLCDVAMIS